MTLNTDCGSPWADSFITRAEADDIIGRYSDDPSKWNSLSETRAELFLSQAADMLSVNFPWRGYRVYRTQALAFPRKNCQEKYGIPLNEIPRQIKEAQALLAQLVVSLQFGSQAGASVAVDTAGLTVSSLTIGGLSVGISRSSDESTQADGLKTYAENAFSHIYTLVAKFTSAIHVYTPLMLMEQLTWPHSKP